MSRRGSNETSLTCHPLSPLSPWPTDPLPSNHRGGGTTIKLNPSATLSCSPPTPQPHLAMSLIVSCSNLELPSTASIRPCWHAPPACHLYKAAHDNSLHHQLCLHLLITLRISIEALSPPSLPWHSLATAVNHHTVRAHVASSAQAVFGRTTASIGSVVSSLCSLASPISPVVLWLTGMP